MRQLYFDLFSGVAGDMLIGALLDAGAPEEVLRRVLASVAKGEFHWELRKEKRHTIAGTRFVVDAREGHVHRGLADVLAVVDDADLSERAREWARTAFRLIAQAEARCHDTTPDKLHFHEVGAVDAIVDVCGACALVDALDPVEIWASPVATGQGLVRCAHGNMPVPAPGTLELLLGIPTAGRDLAGERATPTGVALLRAWGARFGSRPAAVPERTGYGVGSKDPEDVANLLRVVVEIPQAAGEALVELRTLADDQSGEVVGAAIEAMHAAGAVEAYAVAALAKKGRPAFEVCVLCEVARRPEFEDLLFRHLGTLGMRVQSVTRTRRPRSVIQQETPLGTLPFKVREDPDGTTVLKPEFAALQARAAELGITPREALERLAAGLSPPDPRS